MNNNTSKISKSNYNFFTPNTFIIALGFGICVYTLIYFYTQYKQSKTLNKPALQIPQCPDYWDITAPNICSNSKKLGTCRLGDGSDGTVNFNDPIFTNVRTGNFMKCNWAKTCGISWQGIDTLC
jgi:hypothetical protein